MTTSTERFTERLTQFDNYLASCFTITESDYDLMLAAAKVSMTSDDKDPWVWACYHASNVCDTPEKAQNARNLLRAILDDCLAMNFEGADNDSLDVS